MDLGSERPAVFPRASAQLPLESQREIKWAFIPHLSGNVLDAHRGKFQQLPGAVDSLQFNELLRRHSHILAEQMCETRDAEPRSIRHRRKCGVSRWISANVIQCRLNARIDCPTLQRRIYGITRQEHLFKRVHRMVFPPSSRCVCQCDHIDELTLNARDPSCRPAATASIPVPLAANPTNPSNEAAGGNGSIGAPIAAAPVQVRSRARCRAEAAQGLPAGRSSHRRDIQTGPARRRCKPAASYRCHGAATPNTCAARGTTRRSTEILSEPQRHLAP